MIKKAFPVPPTIYLLVALLAVILLVVGFVVLWAMKLLTGVIIALVLLLISWTILKTGAIPAEKYPWLPLIMWFMPIIGFFAGVYMERARIFYVIPLLQKPQPITPYYGLTDWVQANPEATLIILILISTFIYLYYSVKAE
ncbi:MAG: hypothetical protein NZ932_04035 [Candidatus Bathyarchaeota archaeon]|nr:hypothetical protein [Candidatus Bathyarchaeota archaeon]MDW8022361.1 hypothetical protein [Nitrososphaerota archaeon]